jgi:hypothetical protein
VAGGQRAAGQATGYPGSLRDLLIMICAGLACLVAFVVAARFTSESATPSRTQLTVDQLQPGDCLTGSNMDLGTSSPWPDEVTSVPCTRPHLAEVIFAGDAWPQSAAYPGDDTIGSQAADRCDTALAGYTGGNQRYIQDFVTESIVPDRTGWTGGDRSLVCVAYEFAAGQPVGASVSYSIRARHH